MRKQPRCCLDFRLVIAWFSIPAIESKRARRYHSEKPAERQEGHRSGSPNVDKSLLVGGRSLPAFAGGQVLQPMDLFLSGRATTRVQGKQIPVMAIAQDAVEGWLRRNLHAVNPASHIRVHDLVRQGSADLVDLFERHRNHKVPLANFQEGNPRTTGCTYACGLVRLVACVPSAYFYRQQRRDPNTRFVVNPPSPTKPLRLSNFT